MKKLFILFACLYSLNVSSQQWALTNLDLTIQVVKNTTATFQVGKWLANFAIVGDSVSIIYQRNQDNSHFTLYLDKDSVTAPAVASATALYDTLEAWTTGGGTPGAASDLATTLAVGNITGGTDIELTIGDSILNNDATANTIASWSGNRKLSFLPTATYPSLTELSYVKGVSSAIQTQFTGKVGTSRNLTINGTTQDLSADRTWTVGDALVANPLSQFGATTSLQLLGVLSDETGTGLAVFNNSPTFVDDITIGTAGSATGDILLNGLTSGTVTLTTLDAAGTWTLKLPPDDGLVNQFLQTDGSGNTIWNTGSATLGDADYGDVVVSGVGTVMTVESFTGVNDAADATSFPIFVNSAASASSTPKTNTNLTFDATSGQLGATTMIAGAYRSTAANISTTGVLRLANTGTIGWRNAANSTNYTVSLNASDIFEFTRGIKTTAGSIDAFTGFRINGAATGAAANGTFLFGNGTDYIASTSTIPTSAGATANKWLKSDATNYVLSTSTLAEGGVTAGKILVSDATNWVASTPTFPNASATSRKKIVSDGTNWVASTETWAVPGTSGNILQSDGTNWTSAASFKATTGQTTLDRTSTSTSLADVSDLAAFTTTASTKYYFEFNLSVTTNATTVGILLSVNHSTAITSIIFNAMYPISATANNIQQNLTALNGGVQPTAGNGATIQFAKVWGIVTTNTAGTFALRFASETGAAVVVKAGSTGLIQVVN